jgi:glycosyltransferase involved in cell wall biosynthesis
MARMPDTTRDDAPRVSVVLPARNAATHLEEAIDSILGQSLADLELVAVDDGSTDDTGRILAGRRSRDPRVRVVAGAGRGVARALAAGLFAARAELVAIMNADDVALPERLARQVAYLDAHPGVAAVGSQTRLLLDDGSGDGARPGRASALPTDPAAVRAMLPQAAPLAHPAAMFRRAAALAAGGYRPAFAAAAEDYDLWLRLAERHDLANLPDVLLLYRIHPRQATAREHVAVATATLVAQASARVRQGGRPDPVAACDTIDDTLLAALAIAPDAVARRAILSALDRAESLLAAGAAPAAVRATLGGLAADPVASREPALLAAATAWLEGRLLVAAGRPVAGACRLLRAACGHAGFRTRLAGAPARRLAALARGGGP